MAGRQVAGGWSLTTLLRQDDRGQLWSALGPDGRPAQARLAPGAAAVPELARSVRRQRAVLLALRSRHLLPTLDLLVDGDDLIMISGAPDAPTLREVLDQEGDAPLADALRLSADVAWGLSAAHGAGHVHGALRAEDVLLAEHGQVAGVGWWPLARAVLPAMPAGLAPEVAAGGAPSRAGDLWAVGTLLARLVDGRPVPAPVAHEVAVLRSADPTARPGSSRGAAARLAALTTSLRTSGRPTSPVAAPAPAPTTRPEPDPPATPALGSLRALLEADRSDDELGATGADETRLPRLDLSALRRGRAVEEAAAESAAEAATGPDRAAEGEPTEEAGAVRPVPLEPVAEGPSTGRHRTLVAVVVLALLVAAVVGVVLATRGSSSAGRGPALRAAAPTERSVSPHPTGPSSPATPAGGSDAASALSTSRPLVPASPPVVAPQPSVADAAVAARLRAVLLPLSAVRAASPVGVTPVSVAVPDATDYDAVLRGLDLWCNDYTPVGISALGHQVEAFQVGGELVYHDVTVLPNGAPAAIVAGVRTSLGRCTTLSGPTAPLTATLARDASVGDLSAASTALRYQRTDAAEPPVHAVFLAGADVLEVVMVQGASDSAARTMARRLARAADAQISTG